MIPHLTRAKVYVISAKQMDELEERQKVVRASGKLPSPK